MKKVYSIMKTIFAIFLAIVFLLNLWLTVSKLVFKIDLPDIFGWKHAIVLSGSMEPTFSVGDMLIFNEQEQYEVDDIIIFRKESVFITHRIIDVEDDGFVTQGDANNTEDYGIVHPDQIEGEMRLVIPKIGLIIQFLTSPLGLLVLIIAGIALIEVPRLIDYRRARRDGDGL